MIVASDVTTLEQRGKYNGFIGAMVGVGNGLGPLIGGAVTQQASWRWCFWYTIPINLSIALLLFIVIPKSKVHGKASTKFKMIDWTGLFLSIAAVVLILASCFVSSKSRLLINTGPHLIWWLNICLEQRSRYWHGDSWSSHGHSLSVRRMESSKAPDHAE
jgi:MFS family permease